MHYGKALKRLQFENDVKNKDLKEGVGAANVQMITTWRRNGRISETNKQKICDFFNVSMAYFAALAEEADKKKGG